MNPTDEIYERDVELMDHLRSLMPKNPEPKPHLKASPGSNCKNATSARTGRTGSKRQRKQDREWCNFNLLDHEKEQREFLMNMSSEDRMELAKYYWDHNADLHNYLRSLMHKHPVETSNLKVKVNEKSIKDKADSPLL